MTEEKNAGNEIRQRKKNDTKELTDQNENEEKHEQVDVDENPDDGEEEDLKNLAWNIFLAFSLILTLIFFSVYFYYGYILSKRFTMYLFSRNAWNFDVWPFDKMKRIPPPPRKRR